MSLFRSTSDFPYLGRNKAPDNIPRKVCLCAHNQHTQAQWPWRLICMYFEVSCSRSKKITNHFSTFSTFEGHNSPPRMKSHNALRWFTAAISGVKHGVSLTDIAVCNETEILSAKARDNWKTYDFWDLWQHPRMTWRMSHTNNKSIHSSETQFTTR